MDKRDAIEKLLKIVDEKLDNQCKIYNWVTVVLSILDVVTGLVCIICTTWQITAFVTSILTGTVVCSRTVQVLKAKNLLNTVRTIASVSGAYMFVRFKRGEFMAKIWQTILNNKWTILFSVIGAFFGFITGWTIAKTCGCAALASLFAGIGGAILVIIGVVFLGWEKVKEFTLRTSKKHLKPEAYETLVNVAIMLEEEEKKNKQAEAKYKEEQEALERAKQSALSLEQAKEQVAKLQAQIQAQEQAQNNLN